MARKSRWQQFADSFNATYDTVGNAMSDYESAKALKAEYNDDAGNPLTGTGLDRAKYEALAAIKTKYGDAEGGLNLRVKAAGLENQTFDNDVNNATKGEQVFQRGAGASGLLRANTNSSNASAANSYANANATNVLLPGRVTAQGLANEGTGLSNSYNRQTLNDRVIQEAIRTDSARSTARSNAAQADVDEQTVDSDVRLNNAQAYNAEANATISNLNADLAESTHGEVVAATLGELQNRATEANIKAETLAEQQHARSVIDEIVKKALTMGFESPAEADAYVVDQIAQADIRPGSAAYYYQIAANGIARMGAKAQTITERMTDASAKGLDAMADVLDSEGIDGRVETTEDGTVQVLIDRGDGMPEVYMQGKSKAEVAQKMLAVAKDPSAMIELSASLLEVEKDRAAIRKDNALADKATVETQGLAAKNKATQTGEKLPGDAVSDRDTFISGLENAANEQTIDNEQYWRSLGRYDSMNGGPMAPPKSILDSPVSLQQWYTAPEEVRERWRNRKTSN